jgi:CDP-diglyceride synthetase
MTTQIVLAVILVVMAIVILAGKGDWMIAGYNTASKEEKETVNVKRLRLILGILLLIIAPLLFMLGDHSNKTTGLIFAGIVIVLTTVAVILANTWAKKK